jgi:hypothetical protein
VQVFVQEQADKAAEERGVLEEVAAVEALSAVLVEMVGPVT